MTTDRNNQEGSTASSNEQIIASRNAGAKTLYTLNTDKVRVLFSDSEELPKTTRLITPQQTGLLKYKRLDGEDIIVNVTAGQSYAWAMRQIFETGSAVDEVIISF